MAATRTVARRIGLGAREFSWDPKSPARKKQNRIDRCNRFPAICLLVNLRTRHAESSLLLALVAGTATSSRCRLNRRPCVPLMRCRSFPDIDLYGQKNMEEQRARYGAGCHNGSADCARDCMVGVGSRPLWNHRYRGFPQLVTKKAGGQRSPFGQRTKFRVRSQDEQSDGRNARGRIDSSTSPHTHTTPSNPQNNKLPFGVSRIEQSRALQQNGGWPSPGRGTGVLPRHD